jgi:hypothetical protein
MQMFKIDDLDDIELEEAEDTGRKAGTGKAQKSSLALSGLSGCSGGDLSDISGGLDDDAHTSKSDPMRSSGGTGSKPIFPIDADTCDCAVVHCRCSCMWHARRRSEWCRLA